MSTTYRVGFYDGDRQWLLDELGEFDSLAEAVESTQSYREDSPQTRYYFERVAVETIGMSAGGRPVLTLT